jgi:DNA polymerase III subunit epsilon
MKSLSNRYVAFDVETTGLFVEKGHRIIEIGAVAVAEDQMGAEFQSLVCCTAPISKEARRIHGIAPEMLAGQPGAKEVMSVFRDFLAGSTLVAHNAPFDIGFLLHECARAGLLLTNRYRCTLKMARRTFRGLPDYRLETVARFLDIEVDEGQRHRALDDARLTAKVWIELRRRK